tara:strand:- start:187 stop:885 length:699 start_codon:yes stop_codon:yes gene_type:complete
MKVDKKISSKRSNWKFDKNVVENFDSHINQSVPFYKISHDLTIKLSDFFLKEKSTCYDLGCSTGNLLKTIEKKHSQKKINFYGLDQSKHMIKVAKKGKHNINFSNKNLEKIEFKKSDMIVSLYTIQFLQPKFRQQLFKKIYNSLNWGGAFIYFEKIRGNDARFQDILNFLYFDFKQESGLSPVNILNKEISLRSVLEPYTINANLDFLRRAGFKDIMPIAQYLCFKGFLAIK